MATSNDAVNDSYVHADYSCITNVNVTKVSFLWKIENFSYAINSDNRGRRGYLESSLFPTNFNKGSSWIINLYLHGGDSIRDISDNIAVYLKLVNNSEGTITAGVKLSIIANDGRKPYTRIYAIHAFKENSSCGFLRYIEKDILLDESKGLLHDDTLQLYCEVFNTQGIVNVLSGFVEPSTCSLLNDFESLLEAQLFSDVILNVDGKQLHAHKAILSCRSPVFAAMFKHEMKESTLNEVDITDISYETMKDILLFIYTGKVNDLETMADILLPAADKYCLDSLKLLCEKVLESTITLENSRHHLRLAETHDANHLKTFAIDFINAHGSSVRDIDG